MPVLVHASNNWMLISESDVASSFYTSHLQGSTSNTLRVVPPDAAAVNTTGPSRAPGASP